MDDFKADFVDSRRSRCDGEAEDGLTRCLLTLSARYVTQMAKGDMRLAPTDPRDGDIQATL